MSQEGFFIFFLLFILFIVYLIMGTVHGSEIWSVSVPELLWRKRRAKPDVTLWPAAVGAKKVEEQFFEQIWQTLPEWPIAFFPIPFPHTGSIPEVVSVQSVSMLQTKDKGKWHLCWWFSFLCNELTPPPPHPSVSIRILCEGCLSRAIESES